jgi:hypothetical protein
MFPTFPENPISCLQNSERSSSCTVVSGIDTRAAGLRDFRNRNYSSGCLNWREIAAETFGTSLGCVAIIGVSAWSGSAN